MIPKSDFQRSMVYLMEFEGHDKVVVDTGGLTKWGISQKAFPSVDIAALTYEQASELYKQHYWNRCRCDDLPSPLAFLVFDCAVNQGSFTAIKTLQRALGVSPDGVLGTESMLEIKKASLDEASMRDLLVAFQCQRAGAYLRLNNSAEEMYEKGWITRLLKGLNAATSDFLEP